ncbi:MAG: C39 family peptidase [Lawsonibacter sp.]|nr:C39 family peptidase [Lawsonibacter sp.]
MKRPKRMIIGALLLASICIATMELLFCHHEEPELFDRITTPILRVSEHVQGQVKQHLFFLSCMFAENGGPEKLEIVEPEAQKDAPAENLVPTEFITQDGRSILTGGNVPLVYYNQADADWSDCLFGEDPIGKYGCGPTTMAMVVSSMTDNPFNPAEMAEWAAKQGYSAPKSGAYLSIVRGTAKAFGLSCTPLNDCTAETLRSQLATGGIIVALMGPGYFTKTGHFILLRGVVSSGDVLIADSNSQENSQKLWDPQFLLDELSRNRGSGAPLWLITTAPK